MLGLSTTLIVRRVVSIFALFAAFGLTLPTAASSSSAEAPHVHVQLLSDVGHLYRGDGDHLGLYFKLESGWHIYWQNAGDSGEPPHIRWTLPDGISVGALLFPPPKRLPLGPLMDFGYENEVLFPMRVTTSEKSPVGPATFHAKVDWLVCREVCIPEKAELDLSTSIREAPGGGLREAGDNPELWIHAWKPLPEPLPSDDSAVFQPTPAGFRLAVNTGQPETQAEFFPEDENVVSNPAPQTVTPMSTGLTLDLKKDPNFSTNPAQLKGVLELSGGRNYEIAALLGSVAAPVAPPAFSVGTLASTAFFAFLGGLLLNLMPCVFPVLFLKGLALVNSASEERHKLRAHGLVYAIGILVSFWVLVGALLALRAAGATLGWGFQFQSPIFLLLMASLLFFLGLSLAGQFEIGLTLTSAGGSLATKQGYAGSFFTGVLAVVVATPCTAPFMGAAIGYALAQPAGVTFAVFTALALGLAAPYVALTLQPAWTRVLPKPGAWMDILKQAISVPIFATVIWLAWVLAQAYGPALLAALLVGFLLLAIAGWFLGRWPARRWATGVASLIVLFCIWMVVYCGRTAEIVVFKSGVLRASQEAAPGGAWQPWSADAVQHSLAAGQPVFVDFTASWCLSCQVNERVALDQPQVRQAFVNAHVALFRADWTREDPAITQALTALGRSGVPVYALYTSGQSGPQLLPQVLTPGIVIDAISKLPKAASGE
jgi:thiol:disulfide interchange protein